MKMDIDWHEQCLKNRVAHLLLKERELASLTKELEVLRRQHLLYEAQIDLAKNEGKESFDAEKYAIKRLCVYVITNHYIDKGILEQKVIRAICNKD